MKIKSLLLGLSIVALTFGCKAGDPTRVSILGDSYSTFEGCVSPKTNISWYLKVPKNNRTNVTKPSQTWWGILCQDKDFVMEKNNSYSGSTICTTGYSNNDYSDRAFISRIHDLGNPDVILVFGGTNDAWADSPMGEFKWGNWTERDLKSFRPAMAYMLDNMKTLYPDSKIIFLLNDGLKDVVNSSVKTVCERYDVPVVELKGIDKTNDHPNIRGMQQIAEQLKPVMQKVNK